MQQSHRWSTEETLRLQATSEPWRAPSLSRLVSLWFLFSFSSLIYMLWGFMTMAWRCGLHRHVAHRLGCGECQRCHPLGMRRWRCCVEGRVKLYLGTLLALWRSPRCASAGMNLRSVRNNDTSTRWLREGRVAERWDGGQRERKSGYVQGEKEVEREGDGNVKHESSSFSLPLGFCEDHRTAPENVPNINFKYIIMILRGAFSSGSYICP